VYFDQLAEEMPELNGKREFILAKPEDVELQSKT
jgi:hypothetical protein